MNTFPFFIYLENQESSQATGLIVKQQGSKERKPLDNMKQTFEAVISLIQCRQQLLQ